jgi:hypothetical protein
VKASNSSRFVTGFYQKYVDEMTEHPDFWVLCSFWPEDPEDFYVLSHAEMASGSFLPTMIVRDFPHV